MELEQLSNVREPVRWQYILPEDKRFTCVLVEGRPHLEAFVYAGKGRSEGSKALSPLLDRHVLAVGCQPRNGHQRS